MHPGSISPYAPGLICESRMTRLAVITPGASHLGSSSVFPLRRASSITGASDNSPRQAIYAITVFAFMYGAKP